MERMNDELLIDYMLGESNAAEKQQVEQWLQADAANQKYYDAFVLLWDASKPTAAPEVNVSEALSKVHGRLQPAGKTIGMPMKVFRVAAAVLLLLGGMAVVQSITQQQQTQPIVAEAEPLAETNAPLSREVVVSATTTTAVAVAEPVELKPLTENTRELQAPDKPAKKIVKNDCGASQYACNKTSCPIEICITQKSTCKDGAAAETSYCSLIKPDESGGICYKPHEEKPRKQCGTVVEEITITRISTGEMIVLNDKSHIKAQDLFSHMTGQECGNIIAGVFKKDCDNNADQQPLIINNSSGQLHFW